VTVAIPVVVLSADATPGTIRRLLARGAHAYLTKPFDLAEVAELLRSAAVADRDQQARPYAHERVQPPTPTTSA
jgi:CheY-like chemotaxis protein